MNWITHNLGLKIVSLLLSTILCYYVESQLLISTDVTVQVAVNQEEGLSDDYTWTVLSKREVDATGSPDDVKEVRSHMQADLAAGRLNVILNLSRATLGKGVYRGYFNPVPYTNLRLTWSNAEFTVLIEPKVRRAGISVIAPPGNMHNGPSGMELDPTNTTIYPTKVAVWGRKQDVDAVTEVRCVDIDLTDYTPGKLVGNIPLAAYDKDGLLRGNVQVDPPVVEVHPVLVAKHAKKSVLISPDIIGQPAPGYRVTSVTVSPEEVKLSSDTEEARAGTVATDPVRISGITSNLSRRVGVRTPESDEKISVRVSIKVVRAFSAAGPVPKPVVTPTTTPLKNPPFGATPSGSGH